MNTRVPIDRTVWIDKLEGICARRIISVGEMAKEAGIHYITLRNFMDRGSNVVSKAPTIRIIDAYIKRCER